MRLGGVFLVTVLALPVYADALSAAKRALATGRMKNEGKHVVEHARPIAGNANKVLQLCRFAADASVVYQANKRLDRSEFTDLCDRLGSLAEKGGPWAQAEIEVLRARVERKPGHVFAAAVKIAAVGTSAAQVRAIEYLLQDGATDELKELQQDGVDAKVKDAAQAALMLLENRVKEGLSFCKDRPHLVRRYNDFVSLDRQLGKKTKYKMVDHVDWFGAVTYGLPLSRQWVVLHYREWGGGEKHDLYLRGDDGNLRAVVDVRWYQAGKMYPVLRSPEKADGRNPQKLAKALFAFDRYRKTPLPTKKPKRAKGMRKVKKAYWYEIWNPMWPGQRVRQWVCSSGKHSYGIRVDYRADTGIDPHPELLEFLKTFKIEKR